MEEDEEHRGDKFEAAAANFLFGNIDEKGRLEGADYLEVEAKEHLSSVGLTLAGGNEELQTVATNITKANAEEQDDYDEEEDEVVAHAADAVDYADVGDDELSDEFEQEDKQRLIRIALEKSQKAEKPAAEEDEDYDEEEPESEDVKSKPAPMVVVKPVAPPALPLPGEDKSAAPTEQLPPKQPKAPVQKIDPNDILRFTRAQVPKVPKRQRLGVNPKVTPAEQQSVEDDAEELNALPRSPKEDPIQVFLQNDTKGLNEDEEFTQMDSMSGDEQQETDSGRPLKLAPRKLTDVQKALAETSSLLVQYPWEEKIHWSDDSEELSNPPPPKAQDADDDLEWEEDDVWIDSNEDMKGGANGDNNLPGVNKDRSTPMEVEEASKEAGDLAPGIGHSRPDEKVKHVGNTKSDQESGDAKSHVKFTFDGNEDSSGVVSKAFAVNKDLEADEWMQAIQWASESEQETAVADAVRSLSKLWLDLNDRNLSLEPVDDDENGQQLGLINGTAGNRHWGEGAIDPFNISNDKYYFYGNTVRGRRVDRQSVLRGLHHAPPCVKARTSDSVPSDEYLTNFHRPMFIPSRYNHAYPLNTMRRKRPKGGMMQIAGQVPKKRSDLSSAAKDAFRVYLFEYALERLPATIPLTGMASRIITYARRKKRATADGPNPSEHSTGLNAPKTDIMYLAKDDAPPLYAGDLPPDGTPISIVESTLYAAPCQSASPVSTDFLVVVKDNQYYVREIDEVVAIGATEPRFEVMAPNTDRFKKYAHDNVLLWILREFERKKRKGIEPVGLKRPELAAAFTRRRTYPQTSLPKILKEVSIFEGGTYIMSEPAKGFPAMEADKLRTITPEETCAFEAMEAGWEALIRLGITIFTHPTSQGNILAVSEKTGLNMGRPVAEFIRQQLVQTPWYRSSQMIDAMKSYRTQLNSALTRARAANDLSEGGSAAESRLAQMSSEDCFNLLTSFYKVPQKKIPADLEGRRDLLRVQPMKRGKGSTPEEVDFPAIVQDVIARHRTAYSKAATAAAASSTGDKASGGTQGSESYGLRVIPLETQLKAFAGNFSDIHADDEKSRLRYYDATLFSKLASEKPKKKEPAPHVEKPHTEKPAFNSQRKGHANEKGGEAKEQSKPTATKKIKKFKVTKKVKNAQGEEITEVRYVTEPAEIERIRNQQALRAKKLKGEHGKAKGETGGQALEEEKKSANPLKISIGLQKISKATKAGKSVMKGSANAVQPSKGVTTDSQGKKVKIKIDRKFIEEAEEAAAKRRQRTQYGDEAEFTPRKVPRNRSDKTRRTRNGMVILNEILAQVEREVRNAQGYIAETEPNLVIKLVDPEEPVPHGAKNLATPQDTGLDFTTPVKNVPAYGAVVKEQMYLNLMRIRCTQPPYYYKSSDMFLSDMKLMVENAEKFNTTAETQWVIQHAQLMLRVAENKVDELKPQILEAEELVRKEEVSSTKDEGSIKSSPKTSPKTKAELVPSPLPSPEPMDVKAEPAEVGNTGFASNFQLN